MEKNYYFVGIKGTGMAALARVLHDRGCHVEGSDIEKETFTQAPLEQAGIQIHDFDPANIKPGMTIVQGNAFSDDQPEIVRAKELGDKVQSYPATVEELVEQYTSIGVAGAHGKTSTTALLSHVLSSVAPTTYLIGDGEGLARLTRGSLSLKLTNTGITSGLSSDYAIMTNIDFDHPDFFKDIDDVRDSFETYGKQVKKAVFAWGDDENLRKLQLDVPIYYYGTSEKDDFRAVNIQRTPQGSTFEAWFKDEKLGEFEIHLYGEHSVLNSLAVIAVAYMEKVDLTDIAKGLASFSGVKRRFAESRVGDMTLIDDYAHHPSEIKATIDAARQKYPDKQVLAVFQPHTYSRLQAYLKEFGQSLSRQDICYANLGSIRENAGRVSSQDLEDLIPQKRRH